MTTCWPQQWIYGEEFHTSFELVRQECRRWFVAQPSLDWCEVLLGEEGSGLCCVSVGQESPISAPSSACCACKASRSPPIAPVESTSSSSPTRVPCFHSHPLTSGRCGSAHCPGPVVCSIDSVLFPPLLSLPDLPLSTERGCIAALPTCGRSCDPQGLPVLCRAP